MAHYKVKKEIKNDRFLDDPAIKERLAKSIQSNNEEKIFKLTDDQLKKLLNM